MALVWDPIADCNVPPEAWHYLYNFEVFHRRSIPSELLSGCGGGTGTTGADTSSAGAWCVSDLESFSATHSSKVFLSPPKHLSAQVPLMPTAPTPLFD